jgi:DedD protein
MEEPALRDIERWKDKIEVHLDNRQVFFLFFGSALVACMLFVLGVIVGKRIESRGHAAAPEVQDPLAVLDRVNTPAGTNGAPADQGLTFPKALIGTPAKTKLVAPAPAATPPRAAAPVPIGPPKTAVAAAPPPGAAPAAPRPIAPVPAPAGKTLTSAAPGAPSGAGAPKASSKPTANPILAARPAAPKPASASPAPGVVPAATAETKAKGKFTLQLSSFPDRAEAENFARRFAAQGAFVITSEIPGKGTWYRVRMGNFASAAEATTAKTTFEKQHNIIAYVAAR